MIGSVNQPKSIDLANIKQQAAPIQRIMNSDLAVSTPITLPDSLKHILQMKPEDVLFNIMPLSKEYMPSNFISDSSMVPLIFSKNNAQYIGQIKVGYARDYLGFEYAPYSKLFVPPNALKPSLILAELTSEQVQMAVINTSGVVNLSGKNLQGLNLTGIKLWKLDLRNADLRHANISHTKLASWLGCIQIEGANLSHANLEGVKANTRGISFRNALMQNTKLRNTDLSYADLRGVDFSYSDLSSAQLSCSRFSKTIGFWKASAKAAQFCYATLIRANLSWADLQGCDFTGANLKGAILTGANLKGANFESADLSDVDLRKATYNQLTKWPDGFQVVVTGAVKS
jgi:uncharacterized protein YjbI with pentapeptide repeats